MMTPTELLKRLRRHEEREAGFFQRASIFLTTCQVLSPYVEKGQLRGVVCPWELIPGSPILEDFHDTLEAIWVWSHYRNIAHEENFDENVRQAWSYIHRNLNRFKPLLPYDATHLLLTLSEDSHIPNGDRRRPELRRIAVDTLTDYLSRTKRFNRREYYDPFWMLFSLAYYSKRASDARAARSVRSIIHAWEQGGVFELTSFKEEPRHRGTGGHDYFSKNANKILALTEALGVGRKTTSWLKETVKPLVPSGFLQRHVDENAWNSHVAMAMAASYRASREPEFLSAYFSIMDELRSRDKKIYPHYLDILDSTTATSHG